MTRLIRPGEATRYDLMAVDLEAQRLTDFAGNVVDEKVELGVGWAGPLQTVIEASHAWRREALGSDLFALQVTEIEVEARPSGLLSLEADLAFGDEFDTDNAGLFGLHLHLRTTFDFEGLDLVPQQRSLFVKLGYGWQF